MSLRQWSRSVKPRDNILGQSKQRGGRRSRDKAIGPNAQLSPSFKIAGLRQSECLLAVRLAASTWVT
jgi:hypothetical protein